MKIRIASIALLALVAAPRHAAAQLDPLLFIKRTPPNVIVMVDTANRMQRDQNNDYRDNGVYTKTGALYEIPLGVTAANTTTKYRRKYVNLLNTDNGAGSDKFTADKIVITGDRDADYTTFDERTKINIAKKSLIEAINRNSTLVRFALMRMRQNNPAYGAPGNEGPVVVADGGQQFPTDNGNAGKWNITRPTVGATNGSIAGPVAALTAADAANANTTILTTLAKATGTALSLIPAGKDAKNSVDAPVDNMLDDAKAEAKRLIDADAAAAQCRNTVVVLIVAGGEGQTTNEDPAAKATQFKNVSGGHRVPIYVIALVPPAGDVAQLQAIAANSGGQYFEITKAMIDATVAGQPVAEVVKAVNTAVQHTFATQADFDTAPTVALPHGPNSEFQVTSPIVGTVDLTNAKDITGVVLPNTDISNPATGVHIPQRANLLVTSAFSLPGFDGQLRGFRTYKPVSDSTKPSGYKYTQDGTRLWVGSVPAAASRNIYTALPNGTIVAFNEANATTLRPYLCPSPVSPSGAALTQLAACSDDAGAASLITAIRSLPLGAIVDSTPAIMDPPSLDPPPDSDYPGFAADNEGRRSIVWVGANDGMFHAIDARLGVEVWAYIPFNLLPKLGTLRKGQPVGDFRFFVDGSPKIADVKIDGTWRTYLILGEGPGGTFYQTFDVTLDDMASFVASDDDTIGDVLSYFSDSTRIALKWAFPKYADFDPAIRRDKQGVADCTVAASDQSGPACNPWGDLKASASDVEKSVGETWSDPAVGQIESNTGNYAVVTGSGFLKYSIQHQANRGDIAGGTTFYILDAKTGLVLDSRSVGNDTKAETVDNCADAATNDCRQIKNALQADPVATGPPDSRYISKAYIGDLDGRLWRFDIGLDATLVPKIKAAPTKLYDAGAANPMFASMATVTVGGAQQYLFQGTGSDLLPSNKVNSSYSLFVILDNGTTGTNKAQIDLEKTDGAAGDEKVTAFPAVAGDIVFFSSTTFHPTVVCGANVDANLYAFTFIGGAAYDTTGDGTIKTGKNGDSTKVSTTVGARATAPFVVDQHLAMTVGNKLEMFGDKDDYNNGVGQVGVRILSWREVR